MHVIVLERYPSSQRGGQERSLSDVARILSDRGHHITLIHTHPGNLLSEYSLFCDQILTIRALNLTKHWRSPLWLIQDLFKISRQIRVATAQPNCLIYINQPYDVPFAALLSLIKQWPIVCHLRLPAPKKLSLPCTLGLYRVNQFISVSQATCEGWRTRINAPITVVHNGMIPDRFDRTCSENELRQRWGIAPEDRVICYVGRLDHMKGLGTLLQAFVQVLKNHPQSQLLIAGKPLQSHESHRIELEQLSQNLGISDRVKFLGHVDVPIEIFHISDLSILPSQWAEPFGRSIIESMMAGTPVIASRVGGIVEILSDEFASGLFTASNIEDLTQTIEAHLHWRSEDPGLGDRVKASAQKRFNLEDKLDDIEKVLANTVAKSI
ncbi:MAG: glycosyltransferase family 4 protein [Cyanobacteria bacterium]|nr:glycosyltransferase family 4 protein [Cyanobacteriota bacterium]